MRRLSRKSRIRFDIRLESPVPGVSCDYQSYIEAERDLEQYYRMFPISDEDVSGFCIMEVTIDKQL